MTKTEELNAQFPVGIAVRVFDGLIGTVRGVVGPDEVTSQAPCDMGGDHYLSVDVFIPEDHPDFLHTGVRENFWLHPDQVEVEA